MRCSPSSIHAAKEFVRLMTERAYDMQAFLDPRMRAFTKAGNVAAKAIKRHEKRLQKFGTLGY